MKNFVLFCLLFVCLMATQTFAATFIVTRSDDRNATCNSGADCSLREAINVANAAGGDDTIEFLTTTINLTLGELLITSNITITGPGARLLTVQRSTAAGTGNFRVLNLQDASGIVNISGLSIANGFIEGGGGGVRNGYNNTLNLSDVTIRNNTAMAGGGINNFGILNITRATIDSNTCAGGCGINNNGEFLDGTVTISNSTITNNQATLSFNNTVGRSGGGIVNAAGDMILTNVTVSHNTAAESSGGVNGGGGRVYVRNTIIANNTAPSDPDVNSGVFSLGNNLIGIYSSSTQRFMNGMNGDQVGTTSNPIDPKLGNLQNNGGQTDTRSLLFGSPAVDAGNNCVFLATCPSNNSLLPLLTDQRGNGFTRSADGNGDTIQVVDIGAYELQQPLSPTAATVSVSGRVTTAGGRAIMNVRLTLTDSQGNVRTATTDSTGYYQFDDVQVGETYVLAATGKRYSFSQPVQVLNINEEANQVNFIANSEKRLRVF